MFCIKPTRLDINHINMRVDSKVNDFPIKQNPTHKRYKHISAKNDIYMLIPKGMKCFLWFKNENPNVCLLVYNKRGQYFSRKVLIKASLCTFQDTIVYGTKLNDFNFVIEDIHMYKSKNISSLPISGKYPYIREIIRDANMNASHTINHLNKKYMSLFPYLRRTIRLSFVHFTHAYHDILPKLMTSEYECYGILAVSKSFGNGIFICSDFNCNFFIERTEIDDIYKLFCCDSQNTRTYYGNTSIHDFSTSKNINSKLNPSLSKFNDIDYIEYSDSEEESDVNQSKKENVNIACCIYDCTKDIWKPIKVYDLDITNSQKYRVSNLNHIKYCENMMRNMINIKHDYSLNKRRNAHKSRH